MKATRLILFFGVLALFSSCGQELPIPKPPTYLRLEVPESVYKTYSDSCGFEFDMPETFSIKTGAVTDSMCNRIIDLGPLNGSLFIYYWDVNKPLSFYINNANDEVGNHKLKATSIIDEQIRRKKDRVFGTRFELQGNVATPFQFYLTDSTDRFLFAEVLFNSAPNYDSLKPTLDHFHKDLDRMLESFKWKK
jgi:gliding motility-associated lipoprotein GldD